ncbi:acyltransferase family protein [Pseudoduganella plicata]|uniref:Acyltransferase n=1 Tax=Pseudoduganella plicata TaxID=321984 RepID=A0A4V1AUF2_9BURK|nr:acyltransferase family protein [Pseudoduganella plicata]QBQ38958.1 acyltransferase [Pseudoduganella plicata]GGY86064.1 acyltransferase [Pseudoduganella plicata]
MSPSKAHTGNSRFTELDGLRALAVVSVILFHCDITDLFNAGFFGVDMFFTISGFIITAMLLKEYRSEGDFQFLNFYFRRLKRLMPPVLGLIVIAFLGTAALSRDALDRFIADTPAAFAYLSNWWQIWQQQDYFDTTPHVLRHLWSLAIEEQFYLILPPLLYPVVKRDGPKVAGALALIGTIASTAWMWHLYELNADATDQNRIYLGTDTHSMGLFLGAALACFWNPWAAAQKGTAARLFWRGAALAALALLGVMAMTMNTSDPRLYRGAFLMVPFLTCVVAYATMGDRSFFVSVLLRTPVIQWFGLRSYSLYLVHWLVFVWMRLLGYTDFSRWPVLAAALAIVLVASEAMYRCVEVPAIRYDMKKAGDVPKVACLAVYAIIAVGFSVAIVRTEVAAPVTMTAAASLPPVEPAAHAVPAAPMPPAAPEAAPAPADPVAPPEEPVIRIAGGDHLYALGDSVLLGAREHLKDSIPGIQVDAAVGRQASHGLKAIREWQGKLNSSSTVLVHLGTNGYINEGQFHELLTELAICKSVILVNVHADRRWTGPNNELIRRMTAAFPNTHLLDWSRVSDGRPEYFVKDGIHLTRRGILALTAQIQQATGGEALPESTRLAHKSGRMQADTPAPAHGRAKHAQTAVQEAPAAAAGEQGAEQGTPGV